MYIKRIDYTDYNGNARSEDAHFNLTEAELSIMEMSEVGGFKKKMERIIQAQDGPTIMKTFQDIIRRSYGIVSDDGRRFIKSDEISTEFEQTEAYSILFMSLLSDPEAAAEFIEHVLPQHIVSEVRAEQNAGNITPIGQ